MEQFSASPAGSRIHDLLIEYGRVQAFRYIGAAMGVGFAPKLVVQELKFFDLVASFNMNLQSDDGFVCLSVMPSSPL
jgi:hypothetical protein